MVTVLRIWAAIGRRSNHAAAGELAAWLEKCVDEGGRGGRSFNLEPLDSELASYDRLAALDAIVRELALLLMSTEAPADL